MTKKMSYNYITLYPDPFSVGPDMILQHSCLLFGGKSPALAIKLGKLSNEGA